MHAQRIIGVTVASIALAMTGMAGATAAQADDGHGHRQHHNGQGYNGRDDNGQGYNGRDDNGQEYNGRDDNG
ncbi:hypothetical protein NGB36_13720, partial [Streptomyces sp. RB6PN25]|nr:hypothetical protein [Streptomyces humicola]